MMCLNLALMVLYLFRYVARYNNFDKRRWTASLRHIANVAFDVAIIFPICTIFCRIKYVFSQYEQFIDNVEGVALIEISEMNYLFNRAGGIIGEGCLGFLPKKCFAFLFSMRLELILILCWNSIAVFPVSLICQYLYMPTVWTTCIKCVYLILVLAIS